MIETVDAEAAEPLQTGRPVLSHRLDTTALTLFGIAGVALAALVDMPTLVPELWIWGTFAGAVALGAACAIISLNVRPKLTTAGQIVAIDEQVARLEQARAVLAGSKPEPAPAEAAGPPVDLDETDLAAIAALAEQVRAEGVHVPGQRKPSPRRRRVHPTTT